MRVSSVVAVVVGLATGTVGAVASYHGTATPGPRPADSSHQAAAVVGRPLPAPPPRVVVRVEPCHRPATLERGACVTRVVRTVVVHDLPAPTGPAQANPTAGPPTAEPVAGHDDASDQAAAEHEDHEEEAPQPPEPGEDD